MLSRGKSVDNSTSGGVGEGDTFALRVAMEGALFVSAGRFSFFSMLW